MQNLQSIPVYFTKCFYKENIAEDLNKSKFFQEEKSDNEKFQIYYFTPEKPTQYNLSNRNAFYSDFKTAKIYVYEKSYIFFSTKYETRISDVEKYKEYQKYLDENKNDNANNKNKDFDYYLGSTIYRICHNADSVNNIDDEIIPKLFSLLNSDSTISFFQPDGNTIRSYDYKKNEYDKYKNNSLNTENNTRTFSFVFYNYALPESFEKLPNVLQQELKDGTYGNSPNFSNLSDISPTRINDNYLILPSRIGVGLLSSTKYKPPIEKFYFKYLESLKSLIHFEIKAKKFNKAIDEDNYPNLDILYIKKERRDAFHLRYDIKNNFGSNNQEKLFWSSFLDSISFNESLTEFIDICESIEDKIESETDKREEEHDKRINRIVSYITIFTIISAFKDGSDLFINLIDSINNSTLTKSFVLTNLISIISPILMIIVIVILLPRIFKKKK